MIPVRMLLSILGERAVVSDVLMKQDILYLFRLSLQVGNAYKKKMVHLISGVSMACLMWRG